MKVHANVSDKKYDFSQSGTLDKILKACPSVRKVLRKYGEPLDGIPIKYKVPHDSPLLREAMSEVDKYQIDSSFDYNSFVSDYLREIRTLLHRAMFKKRDIKVECE